MDTVSLQVLAQVELIKPDRHDPYWKTAWGNVKVLVRELARPGGPLEQAGILSVKDKARVVTNLLLALEDKTSRYDIPTLNQSTLAALARMFAKNIIPRCVALKDFRVNLIGSFILRFHISYEDKQILKTRGKRAIAVVYPILEGYFLPINDTVLF